jgi:hypothetical protein
MQALSGRRLSRLVFLACGRVGDISAEDHSRLLELREILDER